MPATPEDRAHAASPDDPDHDVVLLAAGGDAGAFEELVRRHERKAYNLAYRMLGRPEDARDATQDAFVSAYRRLPDFRGQAAFGTWLHRITVNACYDMLRKRQREPELSETPEVEDPVADPADTAAAVADVQAALLTVPPEFRAVLIMCDVEDLPYDAVAEALEVPVGTVKSRLHRGRVALADALSEPGTSGPSPASKEVER